MWCLRTCMYDTCMWARVMYCKVIRIQHAKWLLHFYWNRNHDIMWYRHRVVYPSLCVTYINNFLLVIDFIDFIICNAVKIDTISREQIFKCPQTNCIKYVKLLNNNIPSQKIFSIKIECMIEHIKITYTKVGNYTFKQ